MSGKFNNLIFTALISLLLAGSFAIAKVRIHSIELGYKIAQLREQKRHLEEESRELKTKVSRLQSFRNLERKNRELSLDLVVPQEWTEKSN